ncbi:MAG: hypothetical protein Q8O41_09605 [Candidatus Methanoperedens sp.]|nr:hypothetical protein [Euryarchaeota archaeon]MCG2727496.1 hypothetical protein [Candidatus Methanoperedenaceae archaeon]MDP2767688.1 hypothetical protein [Candidatus Methanoperedens sp.]
MTTVTVNFKGTQEKNEKILEELHERAKSIRVSEVDVQKMIGRAKEKIL